MQSRRRLVGWKEIATYLGVTEKTARRWEIKQGLPIHRHMHEERSSVFAFETELAEWREQRAAGPRPEEELEPHSPERRVPAIAFGAAGLVIVFILVWFRAEIRWRWLGPLTFGSIQTLTTQPGVETHGSLSSDRHWLAYVRMELGKAQIVLRDMNREREQAIPFPGEESFGPVWSPKAQVLYFVALQEGKAQLMSFVAETRQTRTITQMGNVDAFSRRRTPWLQVTADERYVLATDQTGLKAVRIADGRMTLVAPGLGYPALSPGGKLVALRHVAFNRTYLCLIEGWRKGDEIVSASGVDCPNWIANDVNGASWTRNERLVVSAGWVTKPRFVELDLAARKERPIVLASTSVLSPMIDREGRLVYSDLGYDLGLYRLPIDATSIAQAVPVMGSTAHELGGVLSADRKWLGFSSDRSNGLYDSYMQEVATGEVRRVTQHNFDMGDGLCISADGRWMLGSGSKQDRSYQLLLDTRAGLVRELRQMNPAFRCAFTEDALYLASSRPKPVIWKVDLATGRTEVWVDGETGPLWMEPDRRHLLISSKGVVWRMNVETKAKEKVGVSPERNVVLVSPVGSWVLERTMDAASLELYGWDGVKRRTLALGDRSLANLSVSGDGLELILAMTNQPEANLKMSELVE